MRKPQLLALSVVLALFAAGAFYYFLPTGNTDKPKSTTTPDQLAATGPAASSDDAGTSELEEALDSTVQDSGTFVHPDYGFSFQLPDGFSASAFKDDSVDMVLAAGQGQNQSFQIAIAPLGESDELTPTRIHRDLPSKVIATPKKAHIAGSPALVFYSTTPGAGPTYEVWFTYEGNLYQIAAPKALEREVNEVLQTWSF